MSALAGLLCHALNDRAIGGDYHRLIVVDNGPRGYDVVLRIDGGYDHPADAEDARGRWQALLDAVLADATRSTA
jgi:hypothetical protein